MSEQYQYEQASIVSLAKCVQQKYCVLVINLYMNFDNIGSIYIGLYNVQFSNNCLEKQQTFETILDFVFNALGLSCLVMSSPCFQRTWPRTLLLRKP